MEDALSYGEGFQNLGFLLQIRIFLLPKMKGGVTDGTRQKAETYSTKSA